MHLYKSVSSVIAQIFLESQNMTVEQEHILVGKLSTVNSETFFWNLTENTVYNILQSRLSLHLFYMNC